MKALGLNGSGGHFGVVRAKIDGCLGCGYCNFGCAYGKKLSMLDRVLSRAQREFGTDAVRILSECSVERIESDGRRATGQGSIAAPRIGSPPVATLFSVPASHPSVAAMLMLDHKGIEYRRVDFAPAMHRVALRAVGFRGRTVPALRIDGRCIQGSREISRALDDIRPDPPLFPRDPGHREAVERAEQWGDEELQPVVRRLTWGALKRDRSTMRSYLEGARLGIPTGVAAATGAPLVFLAARLNGASDEAVRADLAALPGMLDTVDRWISEGVVGGHERNAVDFQLGTSVALLGTMEDLRPLLEGRPCERLAREIALGYPGRVGPVFPREWLPG